MRGRDHAKRRRRPKLPVPSEVGYKPPKPTMTLRGRHAERVTRRFRIGQKITAIVQGKVRQVGVNDFGSKPEHHAEIEMHNVQAR